MTSKGNRIYFISGVMQEAKGPGVSHARINLSTSSYKPQLEETLKFIETRMLAEDFLSITITRDTHDHEEKIKK